MRYRINLDVYLEDDFLSDVITCAMEGGVNYWLMCDNVERDENLRIVHVYGLYEAEPEEAFPQQCLGRSDIVHAIKRILSSTKVTSQKFRDHLTRAILEEDGICLLDASDCDTIVQVAVLDEVVYG